MRVLVVDDEAPARRRILRMLAEHGDVEVVGEAADGVDARAQISRLTPDLVLLDIQMPGLDGLALAATATMPHVVFVTAHAEHAVRAFELAAVDYLLKPVTCDRLRIAIERARAVRASPERPDVVGVMAAARDPAVLPRVMAKDGAATRWFEPSEITRLHAEDKYVVLVHEGREYLLERSLSDLERALAPFGFRRVHRAELVAVAAIRALRVEGGRAYVELRDGQRAAVSRRSVAELRRHLAGG